jgi:FMN phosphatase YigB (HAD superfamily)
MTELAVQSPPALPPHATRLDDRRVAGLEAALYASGVAVLSLDCFDTLLWRRVPKPTDAFALLGEELQGRGALADGISAASFARIRIAAEERARQEKYRQSGLHEVTLGEIYEQFDGGLTPLTIEQLRAAEVALERRLTIADSALAEHLSRLAAELDLRVVFVSDMYLSAQEIGHLIDRPEMGDLGRAEVISSADVGIGKGNGLWRLLPERWGVAPEAVVHVGNNPIADYSAPLQAGVRAVYWAEIPERLPSILTAEACHTGVNATVRVPSVDDGGVTTLRGRAAFAAAADDHDDQVAWETGASVLGPVMAGHAEWVHRRTAELGITRALCVMREGRLLKELIESVSPSRRNPALECELLWASRAAIARANIAQADASEMSAMFSRLRIPSVTEAARTLGIDLASLRGGADLERNAAQHAGNAQLLERFLTAVLSDPALLARIREIASGRRANFVAHLRDALGGVRGDVAYIDVGFSGANQEKLQAVIDAEGLGVRLHGLYLMADPCPPERVLRGHRIEGFVGSPGDPLPLETAELDRNRLLLELLLLSEDGSTLEIDDAGRPVSAPNIEAERQRAQRRAVHDGIRAYQRHANGYALAADAHPVLTVDGTVGRRIVERFLVEPTLEEAQTFAGWVAEDDYNSLEQSPLVPAHDRMLRRLTGPQLAEQPADRVLWPAGADALWQDPLAVAARCTLSQAGTMRVQLNRSVGASATATVPLKLGRDGVLIGTVSGEGDDLTGVTVFPALIDGLLRLDALKLSLLSRSSGWRSELWSWSAGDDPAALPMARCAWVAQDILNVDAESALVIALASPLPAGSFIQVELQGGFLPGVDVAPRITRMSAGVAVICPPA